MQTTSDQTPTVSPTFASRIEWDAIVIGAGPAGALSACLLARSGVRVLLVERKAFPRPKVCGGCVNAQALAVLERAGVADRVRRIGANAVTAIRLHHEGRTALLDLPPGLAVSRSALDAELVRAATEAGCAFLPETAALVVPDGQSPADAGWRRVSLQRRHEPAAAAAARVLLVADGLAHSSLGACTALRSRATSSSRVGVGGFAAAGTLATSPGTITMAVGRHGYVGAVDVEDGRVNIAAALDPAFLKGQGNTARAVSALVREAGVRAEVDLDAVDWLGTIPLSRRMRHPAARRLFVLGDAAGYVEPFTGEGMAWALSGAERVVPIAARAISAWDDSLEREWVDAHAGSIGCAQRRCRIIARALRSPWLVMAAVSMLARQPGLARPVVAHLSPRPSGPIRG
jgi:flavin-dependent dehydrogenase